MSWDILRTAASKELEVRSWSRSVGIGSWKLGVGSFATNARIIKIPNGLFKTKSLNPLIFQSSMDNYATVHVVLTHPQPLSRGEFCGVN
jgi:hypothetical protein